MERNRPLTRKDVARAEKREGPVHPFVSLLDRLTPKLTSFRAQLEQIPNAVERRKFISEHLGFLADEAEQLDDFEVTPQALIQIWSKTMEVFPGDEAMHNYPRYAVAEIVLASYATKGLVKSWQGFPRFFLQNHVLPEWAENYPDLDIFELRVLRIWESVREIDNFGRKADMARVSKLAKEVKEGDPTAQARLQELLEHEKARANPLLDTLGENIGTTYGKLMVPLEKIKKQQQELS
jgi:hypothetical protein